MYVYTSINLRNNITFYYKFSAYRRIRRKSPIQNATHRRAVKKLVVVSKRIEKVSWSSFCGFSLYITRTTRRNSTRHDAFPFHCSVYGRSYRSRRQANLPQLYSHVQAKFIPRPNTFISSRLHSTENVFFFLSSSRLRPEIRGNTRNY